MECSRVRSVVAQDVKRGAASLFHFLDKIIVILYRKTFGQEIQKMKRSNADLEQEICSACHVQSFDHVPMVWGKLDEWREQFLYSLASIGSSATAALWKSQCRFKHFSCHVLPSVAFYTSANIYSEYSEYENISIHHH